MNNAKWEPELEVAKEILSYFLRNPQAVDDLEGIARWRLLDEKIRRSVEETELGLEWLVKHGFLIKVSTAGSGTVFSLNQTETGRATSFLGGETRRKR